MSQDFRLNTKPGYLNSASYEHAVAIRDKMIAEDKLHANGIRPLDCWIVCKKVEEKTKSGIILNEHAYDKERECQCIVLAAGPGYRICKGLTEKNVETGQVVPNTVGPGNIVQVLERILNKATVDGEDYWLVESHRVLFVVD